MNLPWGFLLFGAAFFGLGAILGFVRASRRKEKLYYTSAMVSFLVFLVFVFIFLNQFILGGILLIAASILGLVKLPEFLKIRERQLQEVDLSAPLRRRDFFTDKMWLKLALKWGLWKTTALFYLVWMGGFLFLFSIFMATSIIFITIGQVVVCATTLPILFTLTFYQQLKKALKRNTGP